MDRLTRRAAIRRGLLAGGTIVVGALFAACGSTPSAPAAQPTPPPAALIPAASLPTSAPAPQSATQSASGTPLPAVGPGSVQAVATDVAGVPGPAVVAMPPKSSTPITLRFHMRAGGDKSEPAIYVFRPKEWSDATGNKITLEPIPGGANYIPKIDALAASGTIGDLTWTSDVWSEHTHLVENNVLEAGDSFMETYHISKGEWFKSITDTLTFNGKMYGFPKTGHPGDAYIWINLDMFKAAGIAEPPVYGATFDNVREWANKLSQGPKDGRTVYGFYSGVVGLQPITNGVRQFGGDIVGSDGIHSLVDSPQFGDWLNWQYQLIVQDRVHPFSQAIPNGDIVGMFAAEKVAMVHEQRFFQFGAVNAVKGKFPFKAIQFPRGTNALGWGASIDTHSATAASKHKDEALSLTYALADKRFAYLVGKIQGYLSGRVDNLEDLGPYAADAFVQLQEKCTEQCAPFWRAKNLRGYEIESTLNNQLDLVWLGKAQADKSFADSLKKALDEVLAKPST